MHSNNFPFYHETSRRNAPLSARLTTWLAALVAVSCGIAHAADREFNPRRVVAPFPPIEDAPVVRASEVEDQVVDAELVLGVVSEGEARAYPINMLTGPQREIINDELGGRAIAATW